ncbi:MAG: TolC family protein, partial [Verrucomicrobiota bacterium]
SELDAIGSAASSYFDYLSTRSLYEIERENLALTESNYQLAQLRIEIGAAEPVEVFRWEQERASARATLIQRESDRSNALVAFNLEIGAPREAVWDFEDIELADDDYYFLDNALEPLLTNTADFREFGRFAQLFAVDNSPELLAFDLQLASQGILLKESQRRFMPEISGFADYSRVFQGSSFLDTDSENQASVGIQLSLPVFEGGQRKAEAMQNQAVIRGLGAQREKAKQEIEQRALAAFFEIGAAHPNLRLSRQSLEAAEKNYESNQEKYSQGAASILDLLDAQESLLAQRQSAAVAVYDYLAAIHELQRSMAWFEYAKTAEEKGDLVDMLRRFIEFGESADMSRNDEYQKSARERAADALRESGSELLD